MKKCLFLILLGISFQIFGNELVCPYGCGGNTDPKVGNVGKVLLQGLEKIGFLEAPIEISSDDGDCSRSYEPQVFEGTTWRLLYEASYDQYCNIIDDDDEEELEVQKEYHFFREKSEERNGDLYRHASETNLSNYLETRSFIQAVLGDIVSVCDCVQIERLENIEKFSLQMSQNQKENLYLRESIDFEKKLLEEETHKCARHTNEIEVTQARIDQIYRTIFNKCIRWHNWKGSLYCRGLLSFQEGYFIDAFDDISKYLKSIEQEGAESLLPAEAYFYQGILESEIGDYSAAIASLSKAIQKNPENKEAYVERAAAYYELGEFNLSLEDYLASGIRPSFIYGNALEIIPFSSSIVTGILKGGAQSGVEFIPSILSSFQGLGHGLWAFVQDPVQISVELLQSAQACLHFIKDNTPRKVLTQLVPELKQLLEQWDSLGSEEKGEITGFIIGKYGVDIFAGTGVAKGVQLYRALKRANNLLTFEAMAISERNRALIKLESARRVQARQQVQQHANLKIQLDKQGKHIQGHKNFDSKNRSLLEHPNPQKLVNDFCGKGIKAGNKRPGTPGYQEIVNFEEFIGYSVLPETGEKIATSWGKIHYAKDGVHIVPTQPR